MNGEGKDEAFRIAGQRTADLTAQSKAMTAKIGGLELSIKNLEEEVAFGRDTTIRDMKNRLLWSKSSVVTGISRSPTRNKAAPAEACYFRN